MKAEKYEALNIETPIKQDENKVQEKYDYRLAFLYMNIYIVLNLAFNICSKFLYLNPYPETFSALDICLVRGTSGIIIMFGLMKYYKQEIYRDNDPNNRVLLIRGFAGIFYFASMTYCVGHGAISTVFLS